MVSDVCSVLHISVVLRYLEVFAKKMTFIKDKLFPVNEIFSQMLVLQRSPTSSTFYGSLLTKNYKIQTFPSSFTSSQLVVHCSFTEGSLTTKNTASVYFLVINNFSNRFFISKRLITYNAFLFLIHFIKLF